MSNFKEINIPFEAIQTVYIDVKGNMKIVLKQPLTIEDEDDGPSTTDC